MRLRDGLGQRSSLFVLMVAAVVALWVKSVNGRAREARSCCCFCCRCYYWNDAVAVVDHLHNIRRALAADALEVDVSFQETSLFLNSFLLAWQDNASICILCEQTNQIQQLGRPATLQHTLRKRSQIYQPTPVTGWLIVVAETGGCSCKWRKE